MTSAPLTGAGRSSVFAPFVRRNCSDVRPSPWTTASTYGASASWDARTTQPAFRCAFTPFPTNSTRACRMKSPVMRFQTKWNSSRAPHMLAPPAASLYSCETALYVALPAIFGAPTSSEPSNSPSRSLWPCGKTPANPITRRTVARHVVCFMVDRRGWQA